MVYIALILAYYGSHCSFNFLCNCYITVIFVFCNCFFVALYKLFSETYMIKLGFRWVLRRGLDARGKSSEIVRMEKNLWDYSSFFIKQNAA